MSIAKNVKYKSNGFSYAYSVQHIAVKAKKLRFKQSIPDNMLLLTSHESRDQFDIMTQHYHGTNRQTYNAFIYKHIPASCTKRPNPLTIIKVSYSSIFCVEFTRAGAYVAIFIITGAHAAISVTVWDLGEWGRLGGRGLGGRDVDRGDEVVACLEKILGWLLRTSQTTSIVKGLLQLLGKQEYTAVICSSNSEV